MKKILVAALLSTFVAAPAFAADSKMAVGAGYGLGNGGVLSLRGDYDIADMVGMADVKARVGYDGYSEDFGAGSTWSYSVFYAGAYRDFSKEAKLGDKIHPFAGLGFGFGSVSCSGSWCAWTGEPTVGGFYYIGGVKYDVSKEIEAEVSFSGWTGISLGANYKF